ncbi:unnamed protein product, partial [Staurois parvus]
MIGTSHRGPVQRSVFAPREHAQAKMADAVYEWQPAPALLLSGRLYIHGPDGKWL